MDHLGHVLLGVRLRAYRGGEDEWDLTTHIALEAGQLEAIARGFEHLFGTIAQQ